MGLDVGLRSWGHVSLFGLHSISTSRTVPSVHCRGGTVRGRTTGVSTLKVSWGTRGGAHGATNGAHGGRNTALRKTPNLGDSTIVRRRAATTALHAAATISAAAISAPNVAITASAACIECQCVHAINELVEGHMCLILDSR